MSEDTPGEGSPEASKLVTVETAEKILDILSKVQGDTKEKAGEVKLMGYPQTSQNKAKKMGKKSNQKKKKQLFPRNFGFIKIF